MSGTLKHLSNFADKFGIAMGVCAGGLAVSNLILFEDALTPVSVLVSVAIVGLLTLSIYNFDRWYNSDMDGMARESGFLYWRRTSKRPLLIFVVIPIAISFFVFLAANKFGFVGVVVFLAIALLGFVYSLPVIPYRKRGVDLSWVSPKGIPCAKSLYVSMIWFVTLYLIPILIFEWSLKDHLAFNLLVFFRLFVNCNAGDLRDFESDQKNGFVTLPGALGERLTIYLIVSLNLALFVWSALSIRSGASHQENLPFVFLGFAQLLMTLFWGLLLVKRITPSQLLVYSVFEIVALPLVLWLVLA